MSSRYIDTRGKSSKVAKPPSGTFVSGERDPYEIQAGKLAITPAKLASIYIAADSGDTRQLFEVFAGVMEDPHVQTVTSKRKRRVLSRTFEITSAIEDDKRAQDAADLCRQLVLGADGVSGISNWREALSVMADAVPLGFSAQSIDWRYLDDLWRPVRLDWFPQRDCRIGLPYEYGTVETETQSDKVRILTKEEPLRGEEPEPYGWLIHTHKTVTDYLPRAMMLRSIAWWWMFKKFAIGDWTIYSERYGIPLRKGTYPIGSDDADRAALAKAVLDLGKDTGCILPEGSAIELIETAMRGELPFQTLLHECDFQISKAVLGGTLTTDAGERGARSLGEVHERNEIDMANDDSLRMEETIREQLFAPIVYFNLGYDYPVPYANFVSNEQEDLKAKAEMVSIVVNDIGLTASEPWLRKTFNIPEPQPDEQVIGGKKTAPTVEPEVAEPDEVDEPTEKKGAEVKENEATITEDEVEQAAATLGADTMAVLRHHKMSNAGILALATKKKRRLSMAWAK